MCACNVLMQIVFKTRIYHCNINSHVRAPPPQSLLMWSYSRHNTHTHTRAVMTTYKV